MGVARSGQLGRLLIPRAVPRSVILHCFWQHFMQLSYQHLGGNLWQHPSIVCPSKKAHPAQNNKDENREYRQAYHCIAHVLSGAALQDLGRFQVLSALFDILT